MTKRQVDLFVSLLVPAQYPAYDENRRAVDPWAAVAVRVSWVTAPRLFCSEEVWFLVADQRYCVACLGKRNH